MKVYDNIRGRLGNAVFRYFATTLFRILYNADRTYNHYECNKIISDDEFIKWSNYILNTNIIPDIDLNSNYMFDGYYQHDNIYIKYKKEIINWIITHPDELLWTDGNNNYNDNYHYKSTSYKNIDLLINPYSEKIYQIVIHLRLEDFINKSSVIHPESIKNILDKINEKNICIVVNKPTLEIEIKYINYFKKYYNVTLESNSIIEDYHIMKNCKILVCSCSTISWIAAFLSKTVEKVYFPNYKNNDRIHETFKKPNEDTILYEFKKCSKNELEDFLEQRVL
jgi:hypothetical protein